MTLHKALGLQDPLQAKTLSPQAERTRWARESAWRGAHSAQQADKLGPDPGFARPGPRDSAAYAPTKCPFPQEAPRTPELAPPVCALDSGSQAGGREGQKDTCWDKVREPLGRPVPLDCDP